MVPDKLALLPSVKRQVFCVRDRLKMDKQKAWNNNYVVAPKLIGSMTTKGQMKPTFRVSLKASQAGENSRSNVPEHTIVSSVLTDLSHLNFRRNGGRRAAAAFLPNTVCALLHGSLRECKLLIRRPRTVLKMARQKQALSRETLQMRNFNCSTLRKIHIKLISACLK